MSTQLRRMIAVPDAQYRKLMSDLKAGKKAYLSDRVGTKDSVEFRGSDKHEHCFESSRYQDSLIVGKVDGGFWKSDEGRRNYL